MFLYPFLPKFLQKRSETGFLTGLCWFQDCFA